MNDKRGSARHHGIAFLDHLFGNARTVYEGSVTRTEVADAALRSVALHREVQARKISVLGDRIVGFAGAPDPHDAPATHFDSTP